MCRRYRDPTMSSTLCLENGHLKYDSFILIVKNRPDVSCCGLIDLGIEKSLTQGFDNSQKVGGKI